MLPEKFCARMRTLLADEYDAFAAALEEDPIRALRINRLKYSGADEDILPFWHRAIPHEPDGYLFRTEGIGHTPLHHAGAYYVQDPGAMSAVCALPPMPRGARVCDICAAPGGKSAQLAARIDESGWLLSNEIIGARAQILLANTERLGMCRTQLTNLSSDALSGWLHAYFDVVVADVPCSGEGMFRKSGDALTGWSPELVRSCAQRGEKILDAAAGMVRAGGYLLYSTCTYAPEENEEQVQHFLERHPEYEAIPPADAVVPVTAPGISLKLKHPEYCRRFYPHIAPGEGQFFVVLRRNSADTERILYKDAAIPLTKAEKEAVEAFLKTATLPQGYRLCRIGERMALVPCDMPVLPRGVFSAGVTLGQTRGKTFVPHHHFFSAMGLHCQCRADLSEQQVRQYLHGDELSYASENGWYTVCYRGIPIGGAKVSGGRMKNHYPKGLRNQN